MQYWVVLRKRKYDHIFYHDYFLDGLIPEHVLELMIANTVNEKMGLCKDCEAASKCHVIEEGTGKKYCPILFHDVIKPNWKLEQLF